jgi:hypothetical protein
VPDYDYDFWRPMMPWQAKVLFAGFDRPWWVAGGWAIDLYLGHQTREHHDLDIGLFACDQAAAQRYLARCGWELHCADPPGSLRPWAEGEDLPLTVHDVWCRRSHDAPWELQLMLNPGHDGHWLSRRDPRIRLPAPQAVLRSGDGIPYLAPQVQLHFKAKSPRDQDEADFDAILPNLDKPARSWLRQSISATFAEHPWLTRL